MIQVIVVTSLVISALVVVAILFGGPPKRYDDTWPSLAERCAKLDAIEALARKYDHPEYSVGAHALARAVLNVIEGNANG